MPCAAVFRLQANTCRQLASSATELWVAAALTELADALLERADRMAKDTSASRSFHRKSSGSTVMERSAMAATRFPHAAHPTFKARLHCPACKERIGPGKGACYCEELHRREAYDQVRARRGLAPLYRPPSMR